MYTGECGTNNHCQLYTWCPPEDDTEMDIINNIGDFTAFINIDAVFDRWNISLSNTNDIDGSGHPVFGYNLFTINDILDEATDGIVFDVEQIATEGAIILISSRWYCDFDRSYDCNPTYDMQRIDGQTNTITN
eukprot:820633_1